jgi:hypothetical protein
VGQFIGSATNYVEWDNLLGVGQFIWRGTIYLGPGQFSGSGTNYVEWDNLVGEGQIMWSGTI